MPLHLLPKKSWHVYSSANISRVRADEASQAAQQEAQDQRMQEIDSARRTAILRGEKPPALEDAISENESQAKGSKGREGIKAWDREEKKRKRRHHGEDETDHAIRLAKVSVTQGQEAATRVRGSEKREREEDVCITDTKGHISLFPEPEAASASVVGEDKRARRERQKDESAKELELRDASGMQFKDAAGYGNSAKAGPWYVSASTRGEDGEGRDAFGRVDPERKGRDAKRLGGADPLAFMKVAQRQIKDSERDRREWERVRREEVGLDRKRDIKRRKKREREGSLGSLEGFALDGPKEKKERHRTRGRDGRTRERSRERIHDSRRNGSKRRHDGSRHHDDTREDSRRHDSSRHRRARD